MQVNQKFKSLIPPLSEEEYNQLEANLIQDGIREPISLWNDTIIDGHNRYEIAEKHKLNFSTIPYLFDSENDVVEWIIINQFGRRNLSAYDRSILALKLKPVIAEKAKEKQLSSLKQNINYEKSAEVYERNETRQRMIDNGVKPYSDFEEYPAFGKCTVPQKSVKRIDTQKEIAKIAGVSHDTISKVEAIEREAPIAIKEKIKSGNISINQAYNEVKKIEKQQQRESLAEKGKAIKVSYDLRLGDFEEVFADIKDNSVDCIITDPPYPYEFIECWSKLSRFAKRVLKPHGFCIAYSGQTYLPEVIQRLSEHLDYYWCMSMYMPGGTQIVNSTNMMCRWKPILLFQNGRKCIRHTAIEDYFVNDKSNKDGHDWQQGETGIAYLIEKFTNLGDLIVEPFCGAGTTLKVAKALNRNCIGAEIDEQTYNIAKARLS